MNLRAQFIVVSLFFAAQALADDPARIGQLELQIDSSRFSEQLSFKGAIESRLAGIKMKAKLKIQLVPADATRTAPEVVWKNAEEGEVIWPVVQLPSETGYAWEPVEIDPEKFFAGSSAENAARSIQRAPIEIEKALIPLRQECFVTAPPPVSKPSLREEAKALGVKLQEERQRSHECPKNFKDIDQLKKLAKQLMSEGAHKRVDLSDLRMPPNELQKAGAHRLGIACGYSSGLKKWFHAPIYAESPDVFFVGSQSGTLDCAKFVRSARKGEEGVFIQKGANCTGVRSYREKKALFAAAAGDMVLIPLSEGVYIQVLLMKKQSFYYGLIFSPYVQAK